MILKDGESVIGMALAAMLDKQPHPVIWRRRRCGCCERYVDAGWCWDEQYGMCLDCVDGLDEAAAMAEQEPYHR